MGPGGNSDSWTTVDRKAAKKKTSVPEKPPAVDQPATSDSWQQVGGSSRDRRRKEPSAGPPPRPEGSRGGGRGPDRGRGRGGGGRGGTLPRGQGRGGFKEYQSGPGAARASSSPLPPNGGPKQRTQQPPPAVATPSRPTWATISAGSTAAAVTAAASVVATTSNAIALQTSDVQPTYVSKPSPWGQPVVRNGPLERGTPPPTTSAEIADSVSVRKSSWAALLSQNIETNTDGGPKLVSSGPSDDQAADESSVNIEEGSLQVTDEQDSQTIVDQPVPLLEDVVVDDARSSEATTPTKNLEQSAAVKSDQAPPGHPEVSVSTVSEGVVESTPTIPPTLPDISPDVSMSSVPAAKEDEPSAVTDVPSSMQLKSDEGSGCTAEQEEEAPEPNRVQKKAVMIPTVMDKNGNAVINEEPVTVEVAAAQEQIVAPSSLLSVGNDGRKQYDRDFLLQLQTNPLSLQKPAQLPDLEIVLSPGSMRSSASAPQLGDLSGTEYVRGSPARRDSRRRDIPTAPPKKVISISREPVKLHQAENAWTPGAKHKSVGELAEVADELEVLAKQVRSILNKLTPQKFDRLVEQFKELPIDTEEKLIRCTDLIFEKALDEPSFSVAYARMCKVLSLKKVPKSENSTTEVVFRAMLISRCQKEFEKDYISEEQKNSHALNMEAASSDEERKRLTEEFAQLELRQRRRSLGNIRFIGELFKQEMITGNIMHSIIVKLLAATDEESLESLCSFLTTVGQILEEKTKRITGTNLEKYFERMAEIIREKKTSSRVRFLMQDVIDLRRNNWVSRRKEAGPKTIEEIHKEAKLEASLIELADATAQMGPPPSSRRSEDRRRSRLEAKTVPSSIDEGWSNVPSRAAKMLPEMLDSSRLRLSKVDTDKLQLGPPGSKFTTWGRGSSAAGRKTSQTADLPTVRSSNRFLTLYDSDSAVLPVTGGYFGRASEPVRRSAERSASRSSSRSGYTSSRNQSAEGRKGDPHPASAESEQQTTTAGIHVGKKLCGPVDIDHEVLKSKFGTIFEEYLTNCDYSEACNSICHLFCRENICNVVEMACSDVLDRSVRDQRKVGELLRYLVRDAVLSFDQISQGIGPILEIVEDVLVDIPKFWEYLGEILTPLMFESNAVDSFLEHCFSFLRSQQNQRDDLTVAVLAAVQRARPEALVRIIGQTGNRLDSYLNNSSGLLELLAAKGIKLADPVTNGGGESDNVMLEHKQPLAVKLSQIFARGLGVNEELAEVEPLLRDGAGESGEETATVRTLVTCLLESVIRGIGGPSSDIMLDSQLLDLRVPILKIALDRKDSRKDREFQLQALYAIQELVHRLEHPTKLLHTILERLYDLDVLSEDSLVEWEQSKDPEEQKGKGVALKSCTQFFKWLKEADEEGEEEEKVRVGVDDGKTACTEGPVD